ncbi:MAG: threonylcarbamoyl-AMP synthase [Lachnospiraceae bacterium]|nr:threonylcarbamoyl-AMP synthase [Lachnospiraceae bacterium]
MDSRLLKEAGNIIKAGGLVAFPTETVYGLGGDALNPESARKIYEAKGRPADNPLIVHIADFADLERIVSYIPETARILAECFWPGPMTMILNKADCVPYETTGGLSTIAVRYPADRIAQAFIKEAGGFVAAPSANTSGKPSPTNAGRVYEDLSGRIDMLLDGGDCEIGLESTIIDLTEDTPVILRPGGITMEMLMETLGCVDIDQTLLKDDLTTPPKAPGMKYRHYAPKGQLIIVEGGQEEVVSKINTLLSQAASEGKRTGVIGTTETVALYHADSIKNAGDRKDEEEIARNLYSILREFDDEGVEVIYSEAFEAKGLGQAVMNRLLKAAGHRVISAK